MQQWYVKFPREEIGPIADNQLIAYRDIGHVTRETLLHNRDGNWKKATRTLATVVWVVAIIVISILTLITLF